MEANTEWLTAWLPATKFELLVWTFVSGFAYLLYVSVVHRLRSKQFPDGDLITVMLTGASLPTLLLLVFSLLNHELLTLVEGVTTYLFVVGSAALIQFLRGPFKS